MRKIVFAAVSLLFSVSLTFAQQISFEKKDHNFGTFPEETGKVTYEFVFTNTGDAPLVLNKVSASCGCTTPAWTKEPIAPGKAGKIEVTYSAQGRPGTFGKSITVFSNSKGGSETLLIKGEVTPKSKNPEVAYPYSLDNGLLTNKKEIKISSLKDNETKKEVFSVFNNNSGTVSIKCNTHNSKFIEAETNIITLSSKTTGQFTLVFNGKNAGELGPLQDYFTIDLVNGTNPQSDKNRVNVKTTVVENFDNLTKEGWDNAPVAELSKVLVSFDKSQKKEKIEIKNTGKTLLKVRRVAVDNDVFTITGGKDQIKPGASATYTVSVKENSKISGNVAGAITFITNDPGSPIRTVKISANL